MTARTHTHDASPLSPKKLYCVHKTIMILLIFEPYFDFHINRNRVLSHRKIRYITAHITFRENDV